MPETATAYAHRESPFGLNIHGRWYEPDDDAACLAWVRDFFKSTKPFAEGVYVNFLGDEGVERVRDAYPQQTWERLVGAQELLRPHEPLPHEPEHHTDSMTGVELCDELERSGG